MTVASPLRNVAGWHVLVIVAISAAYQSLFVHHGIGWLFDEGWPLYAAMQLHDGGVLYADVLFPFPPGHLLVAWIAYAIEPPGIILARVGYAGFDVALCVAFYYLARRLCSPGFALLAALLLAVAAPRSQLAHLLFGYRYLVFSVLVLLLLDLRLRLDSREDSPRRRAAMLLALAGALAGVALYFRLTPAFAVSCGVAVALVAAAPSPRVWLRDGLAYAAGLLLVVLPILAWFQWTVGVDVLWREVVTRIVALQGAQSLASPAFTLWPESGERDALYRWWVSFQYRAYIALYAGYSLYLAFSWWRSRRAGTRFEHGLLLAVVVWGAVYLLRTLGRSDDHHLMSALPPALLVVVHAVETGFEQVLHGWRARPRLRAAAAAALCGSLLFGWVYLQRVDLFLQPALRGEVPIAATGGRVRVTQPAVARGIDGVVLAIQRESAPGEIVLDLTGSPLLHPLSGRRGPGGIDVVSPGIFLDAAEEAAFVERLAARPPALVVWPGEAFDRRPDRHLLHSAPALAGWVQAHYREVAAAGRYRILRPATEVQQAR